MFKKSKIKKYKKMIHDLKTDTICSLIIPVIEPIVDLMILFVIGTSSSTILPSYKTVSPILYLLESSTLK